MKRLIMGLLAFALCACAQLGLQEAKTLEERIAYASGTNTGIRDASTDALDHGSITSKDMEYIIEMNDKISAGLKAARSVAGTDPTTAEGRLAAALTLLRELQAYTRARGVKSSHNLDWRPAWLLTEKKAWTSPLHC